MQKVLLTIRGTLMEGDTSDAIELVTEGRLYKNPQGYLLEYDESELTGVVGVTTRLTLENETVTLQRGGTVDTHMVFTPGGVYESNVSTPLGAMHMFILAHRVESRMGQEGGCVRLEYELSLGELSTVNKLKLSFKNLEDCVN